MASVATEERVRDVARSAPIMRAAPDLRSAVAGLHAAFDAAGLPLDLTGVAPIRDERDRVVAQIDDYLLPRLAGLDGPALIVVGGPTGAGKSTLVNSLAGRTVTTPGLLRPTTRSPVLVHHPADREWFGPDRVLPRLDRVDRPTTDHESLQLVATSTVPRGVAVLDAPDFDSIDDRNRELATKLLAAADLLLFVTSAARYSDQVPWLQLSLALERQTAVTVVMNRVPAEDMATVSPHLTSMLRDTGVAADAVFFVEEGTIGEGDRLPVESVAHLRAWLDAFAADAAARRAAVRQTVGGAVRRAVRAAGPVAEAAALQVEAVSELLTVADKVYAGTAESLRGALRDSTLVRGDLMVRWMDVVGNHDLSRPDDTLATIRKQLAGRDPELGTRLQQLGQALDLALETLLVDHAERASGDASRRLRATTHGRALLDWSSEDLSRPGRGLGSRARKSIRAWRQRLADRAAEVLGEDAVGPGRDGRDALALALVIHAVSVPAGAGGEEHEGPGALVAEAREGVAKTLTALLAEDRDRYLQPVLDWNLAPDAPGRLRAAARDAARTLDSHERREV